MTRRMLGFIALIVCFAFAAAAATPDFSGKWKLNVSKSDLGQMPVPDKYEMTVEHKEPSIHTTTVSAGQMGERTMEANYKTDGTETTNKGFGVSETKSKAKWDGSVLAITTEAEFQGNKMQIIQRWSLDPAGKVLTVEQTFKGDQGEFTTKRVLDKQ
ncbi:MAG: hypothetical protein HXY18_11950 [Bryobacteraceae bacterium]|nr:hypothetical protein [Bryobacteraceae bacterium]